MLFNIKIVQFFIMPAMLLFQASKEVIKPSWHDVVHNLTEQNVKETYV